MLMRPPEQLFTDYSAIKKKMDSDWTANNAVWQIFQTEATLDTRLEAGDTSLMAELNGTLPNNNRGQWYFNRVRPLLAQVSGIQRKNRKSSVVIPIENGDQQTADQWTKILLHLYQKEGIYDTISEGFWRGACITGLNLLHVYLDFRNDPISGDIKVDLVDYSAFLVDPYFRKPDLSDASFVWRRSYMSHIQAASIMPDDKYDEIMSLQGNPAGSSYDGRFTYMSENYGQTYMNRLSYDEYYYRDFRKQKLLVDKETGEIMDISTKDNIEIEAFLAEYPQVTMIEQQIPTVRLAISIQDHVMYDGHSGMDRYPFIPVMGYYNPSMPYFYSRIQGIARSLRDPQILFNRRIILNADILESVTNSGWIFRENAVVDVKHLFQTGQGRIIPLKDDAQMTDIQQIQPPNIPPGHFEMQAAFAKELNFVSGITEENMGQIVDDQASGFKAALRQGAGQTTLQPLFDKLDHSQKLLTELMMDIIKSNYTPGKIQLILEGEKPAPLFYNKAFGKYHAMVELGYNTESQRQIQFAQYLNLREIGIMIPDEDMIEVAPIQRKTELQQKMAQRSQEAQQQQQQQLQLQMAQLQAQTELSNARAIADKGLGVERLSRVQENQALAQERKAQAIKDDVGALLDYAKALKELENVDFAQLEKIIAIQGMLKAQEQEKEIQSQKSQEGPGSIEV